MKDYLVSCPSANLIAKAVMTTDLDVVPLLSGPAGLECNYVHAGDTSINIQEHPGIFSIGIYRLPPTEPPARLLQVKTAVRSGQAKYIGVLALVDKAAVIVTDNRHTVALSLRLPNGDYVYVRMTLSANARALTNDKYLHDIRALAQASGLG